MGVADRLHEARVQYRSGLKVGALISLVIAVAATARKRYPRKRYGDKASFTGFLRDEMIRGGFWGPRLHLLVLMPFRGTDWPLEDILYGVLRCNLVHEATLAIDAQYAAATGNGFVVQITDEGVFVFQDSLLRCLFRTVHNAEENLDEITKPPLPVRGEPSVTIGTPEQPMIVNARKVDVPLP